MNNSERKVTILTIETLESLTETEEGIELNEGYSYNMNGAIPQIADGIAKLAIEMDKDKDMGSDAGGAFIALIENYYMELKKGN